MNNNSNVPIFTSEKTMNSYLGDLQKERNVETIQTTRLDCEPNLAVNDSMKKSILKAEPRLMHIHGAEQMQEKYSGGLVGIINFEKPMGVTQLCDGSNAMYYNTQLYSLSTPEKK